MPVLAIPLTATYPALAAPKPILGRLGRVLMALGAVRNKTPFQSATDVLAGRNWFHVGRVDARAIAAKVVDHQPIWDRAYRLLICETVSHFVIRWGTAEMETAVAPIVHGALPYPALISLAALHTIPEAIHDLRSRASVFHNTPSGSPV